jgi:hypothetical protein
LVDRERRRRHGFASLARLDDLRALARLVERMSG